MRSRTELIDCFSTFAQFEGDRFEAWTVDPRLYKSMRQQQTQLTSHQANHQANHQVNHQANHQETFWTLYWYQQWLRQSHPQSIAHLYAYLQEPCYWAAQKLTQRFSSAHYTLADGFQDAIAHTEHILTRYNPHQGSHLKDYARTAFSNYLRNRLQQQKVASICSDWGLLRKLSQTQLAESLHSAGLTQIDTDLLVWRCFKTVCTPDISSALDRSVRTLAPPTAAAFSQMAARYNQLRTQITPIPPAIEGAAITASLMRAIKAARTYLNPGVTSLDYARGEHGTALIDRLTVAEVGTPMGHMMAAEAYAEQQQRRQAIGVVLIEAIAQLDPSTQTLLSLYYPGQLTQKDIASQLKIKQYQVSRLLNRARQQLLRHVARWSKDTLHIPIDSAVLASTSEVIHEWLQQHYKLASQPALTTQTPPTKAPTETPTETPTEASGAMS